jgi:hypothetical protein
MRIKNLLFVLMLCGTQLLHANAVTPVASFLSDCQTPNPTSANVDEVGTNWVRLSWPSLTGASQIMIVIKKTNNGDPISTTFVGGTDVTAQVSTAGANGAPCYAELYSVCPDGEYNPINPGTSPSFDTIIVDLIVSGFEIPQNPNVICTVGIGPSNACTFDWSATQTKYRVSFTRAGVTTTRYFVLNKIHPVNDGPDIVQVWAGSNPDPNFNQKIKFYELENGSGLNIKFDVNGNQVQLANMSVSHESTSPNGKFYHTSTPANGCVVEKLYSGPVDGGFQGSDPGSLRLRDSEIANTILQAQPNPFRDELLVKLQSDNDQPVQLYLYDLTGSVKQVVTVPAHQREITLSTAQLSNGVFFLKVNTEGKTSCLKLVKAE